MCAQTDTSNSTILSSAASRELLPAPVRPTMPILDRGAMLRSTPHRTRGMCSR